MNNKYLKQLMLGCDDDCCNIFCGKNKKQTHQNVLIGVSTILTEFNDIFFCENINEKLLTHLNDTENNVSNTKKTLLPKIDFKNFRSQKDCVEKSKSIRKYINFVLSVLSNLNSGIFDLSHENCEFFQEIDHDEAQRYVLENIFKIFLLKYKKKADNSLGLIISRVFIALNRDFDFMCERYQLIFSAVISDIYKKYAPSLYNSEKKYDFSRECLCTPEFTIKDYANLVNVYGNFLEENKTPFVRTYPVFEELLNVYSLLNFVNTKAKIFPYKRFYLPALCKKLNFKEEYRFLKANCKSLLTYSFILPLEVKAEVIKYENSDNMKSSLQDSFFQALYDGPTEPYLFLHVTRNSLYKDITELLSTFNPNTLKKQIKIIFKGEEGVDSGGIRKEFFQLLSEALIENSQLFVQKSNVLWLNGTNDNIEEFYNLGKIIGIALYNDVILNLPLPRIFFSKILNRVSDFDDLAEIEPEIHTSLTNLRKLSDNEIDNLEMNWEIAYSYNEEVTRKINLKDSESQCSENDSNSFDDQKSRVNTTKIGYDIRNKNYVEKDNSIISNHKKNDNQYTNRNIKDKISSSISLNTRIANRKLKDIENNKHYNEKSPKIYHYDEHFKKSRLNNDLLKKNNDKEDFNYSRSQNFHKNLVYSKFYTNCENHNDNQQKYKLKKPISENLQHNDTSKNKYNYDFYRSSEHESCESDEKHNFILNGYKNNDFVTKDTLDFFVNSYFDFIVNRSIEKQFNALKKGFDLIIQPCSLSFLHPCELEKIMVGSTYININELRKNTVLNNYNAHDLVITHFWEIFEEYNTEDRKKLLQFITGNNRIPVSGMESMKLVIMKNGCDTDRLPSSQTCFNTLLLPEYKTKKKMKEKLDKAITMTKGFYLM
ncbi:hypothetical protein EDEG_02636 [Edhazardia aedis USNM 41457]|uniref:HECT-type E3 ubiquitin transferase n=1 Tax=Edhazardia aedis (strain USNM 41457) TaxID=1003232 RepID=J9DNM7_EDHAE|nr:hypothetical protein EDEG_02636 [Edhazardia aedis USNM 41457]|eukprot:EJW02992.1 hypothetical protein EDEG_02636 [Edhazardia aedis USNM 41457]